MTNKWYDNCIFLFLILNNENKCTVIIPFIGHPSMIYKKSLTTNLESINKKCCTIFKAPKVRNFFSLNDEAKLALQANDEAKLALQANDEAKLALQANDEAKLALQANVVYRLEGVCGKNQTYIGETKKRLSTMVKELLSGNSAIFEHISSCNAYNTPALRISYFVT